MMIRSARDDVSAQVGVNFGSYGVKSSAMEWTSERTSWVWVDCRSPEGGGGG